MTGLLKQPKGLAARVETRQVDLTAILAEGSLLPLVRHGVRLGPGLVFPRYGRGRFATSIRTRNAW